MDLQGGTKIQFGAQSDNGGYRSSQSADGDTPLFFLFHEAEQQHAVRRQMRDSVQEFSVCALTNSIRLRGPERCHAPPTAQTRYRISRSFFFFPLGVAKADHVIPSHRS